MAKLERLERRKARKGSLSVTKEADLQTLRSAQEAEALRGPVNQALVDQEAGKAAQLAGQAGQAAATELSGAALGGTSVQAGALREAAGETAGAVGEAAAGARLGARNLLEEMRERKRDKAMDRVTQASQFKQQLRQGYVTSPMDMVGDIAQALAKIMNPGG